MKLPTIGAAALIALLPMTVWARGGGHSGGSVHVSGYTRADGTYVHDYYRAAPGTAGSGGSGSTLSGGSPNNFYEGLGPQGAYFFFHT